MSVAIYELGSRARFPTTFDAHGVAVSFAADSAAYRADAAVLSEILRAGALRDWAGADYPFHVKLYSVCFALFGPALGFNVVGAEPLNALYYLAILSLVFGLGREVFDRRAGLLAAVAVALWPSFLLHTTQFLKDPLYVAEMLALILLIVRLLTRPHSWPASLLTGVAGALLATALWLTRTDMGVVMVAAVLLGAALLVARQFRGGRVWATNLAGMALLLAALVSAPLVMPEALRLGGKRYADKPPRGQGSHWGTDETTRTDPLSRAAAHVADVRRGFITMYRHAGSNIDGDVEFDGAADLIRYLPRAAAVGFFAPFPNMWLASGKKVGSAGRRLSGVESLAMYAVEGLALLGLWRGRRRLSAWLLLAVAATGVTALGLVVVNVGALYRLRYVFLILLIVLAAEGAAWLLDRLSKSRRQVGERGVAV